MKQPVFVLVALLGLTFVAWFQGGAAPPAAPPNIVILFADDLGYGDLGVYGHPTIRTPHLDRMAAEGMKFTNFYSGSPACTASRYALLTGRLPGRSGFGWVLYPESERGLHPREITLAEGLKQAGYATAGYGKWHLGSTRRAYLPLQNGFDEYVGLPYSNDMIPPKWPPIALIADNDTLEMEPDQRTLTALYTERAVRFIKAHKDEPFFVYVPYAMPHLPLHPGEAFAGTSKRGLYGDVVEEIDWSVGEILTALQEEGLAENTLVFFTSDNGPWLIKGLEGGSSGPLRDGKGSTWEGGMRVPGIAYWPGTVTPGSVNDHLATTLDLYVTALTLAGADVPSDRMLDGKDLSPFWLGTGTVDEKPLIYYGPREVHAVRQGPWKLHVRTSSQLEIDYFEGKLPLLFNVEEDPSETHDVAAEHPEIVAALLAEIEQHRRSLEAESPFWSQDSTLTQ